MKYMLLIYHPEEAWGTMTEQDSTNYVRRLRQVFAGYWCESGHYISGSELHPVSTATSVRVRDGKELATDGPSPRPRNNSAVIT